MSHIAIFDCAIKRPSLVCFNRLVSHLKTPFSYHRPPLEGLSSAKLDKSASAFIIFGSASNVEERLDWHKELADFSMARLQEGKPLLGLCFGHQLMADAFGMKVIKNPNDKKYYGSRKMTFQEDFGSLTSGSKSSIFKAHSYQVSGPLKELQVLATSEECAYDGLYHPSLPYWGFQGHPEASEDFYTHEIVANEVTLDSSQKQAALEDGLKIIKVFSQELQRS